MLRQSQSQKLLQRLSPQQIQLMRLLQVPTMELSERIKEELEVNPALEYAEEGNGNEEYDFDGDSGDSEAPEDETLEDAADGETVDLDDFLRDESGEDNDYYDRDDRVQDPPGARYSAQSGFYEQMLEQVTLLGLDEGSETIARQIVGSLDEDGYLRRDIEAIVDDLAFGQNLHTDAAEVERILGRVQELDPPGIGARDLQECLLLQLRRLPQSAAVKNAAAVLTRAFQDFIQKHYERIQKSMGLDESEFREAVAAILKLNPKPGAAFVPTNTAETYVVPDFFVHTVNGGELQVTLNARNAPELRVSEGYLEMLKAYERGDKKSKTQKEAVTFIKQKLDAARWFIDAIRQRQHTLLSTMNAITAYQRQFFLTGDESAMRPMVLRDIAALTKLDVSTVSRVANSKYVQTEYGTYKLKFFFSEGHTLENGEEVSTRELRNLLQQAVDAEDKRAPLSDEKLTELLAAKGYNLARRTVAKYREQLNIPVARLRRTV